MMKKDIEWLKAEIVTEMIELEPNRKERWSDVKYQSLRDVAQKIDQLDKLEVLSQDWIDKNVVHVRGLGDIIEAEVIENLLVPKREVTETQAWEVLGEKYKITWIELRDNVDKLIEFLNKGYTLDKIENNESTQAEVKRFMDTIASEGIFKIGNKEYVVNEKPIIPKYVGEFIEELKASGDGMDDAFSILRGFYHQSKTADWVAKENRNSETFARVWLDGYTVEEEQKYNVKIKPRSSAGTVGVFLYKRGDGVLAGDNFKGYYPEKDKFRLTEQEIKDFDPRYWAFAKPVEEMAE